MPKFSHIIFILSLNIFFWQFNPLPDDKILDQTNLKAFADDKLNVTTITVSVFDNVENIVEKGEIACTSNFSFFPQCFQKTSFREASKGVIEWEWVYPYNTIKTFNGPEK